MQQEVKFEDVFEQNRVDTEKLRDELIATQKEMRLIRKKKLNGKKVGDDQRKLREHVQQTTDLMNNIIERSKKAKSSI